MAGSVTRASLPSSFAPAAIQARRRVTSSGFGCFERWRHRRLGFPLDHAQQPALVGLTRRECRAVAAAGEEALVGVEAQLAVGLLRRVALDAVALEERPDLLGVARRLLGVNGDGQDQEEKECAHGSHGFEEGGQQPE
jgi:hypothetical protein